MQTTETGWDMTQIMRASMREAAELKAAEARLTRVLTIILFAPRAILYAVASLLGVTAPFPAQDGGCCPCRA